MTAKEYRDHEIKKFLDSHPAQDRRYITLKDGAVRAVADMTSEEYIKALNLKTYEQLKKELGL